MPTLINVEIVHYVEIFPLARKYTAGTSELYPLGANSDIGTNCTLCRNFPAGNLALRNYFLLAPTWIYIEIVLYVEIVPLAPRNLFLFGASSDLPSEWKSLEIPSWGFLFAFAGASELIRFCANLDLCWNCPAGTSQLGLFSAGSDRLWDLRFLDIPSRGFLLVFPRWSLLYLFVRGELYFPLLRVHYSSPFLGNYIHLLQILCGIINLSIFYYCEFMLCSTQAGMFS